MKSGRLTPRGASTFGGGGAHREKGGATATGIAPARGPVTVPPVAVCVLLVSALAMPLRAQITVGAASHVSLDRAQSAHTEIFVAADPADVDRMAVCSMALDPSRSRLTSALYLSDDRGESWRLAVHDTASRYGQSWDPACAFGVDGAILFATLPNAVDPVGPRVRDVTRVHRSTDRGRTWNVIESKWIDNEDLTVDRTGGPHRGRVYLVGVGLADSVPGSRHVVILYSDDGGASFGNEVDVLPPRGTHQGTVGAPTVAEDGRVIVPVIIRRDPATEASTGTDSAAAAPDAAVAILTGFDGGTRFEPPARIAAMESCADDGPPVVAVDRTDGPFRNRMYVAWVDASFGRCQIRLAWSDDGVRWSRPLTVDDPPVPIEPGTGPDAFMPQLRVNRNGVVGISWYDRREDPGNRMFRQRFTASADGGASVLRSVAVSGSAYTYAEGQQPESQFPLGLGFRADSSGSIWLGVATGRAQRTYYQVGDYGGMGVRSDGAFQPVWIDNRSGVPQIYTTEVRVAAVAKTAGQRDAALGALVSDSVAVIISRSVFDAATCSIDLGVDVINRSLRPLAQPLLVRVDEMLSQMGVPLMAGDENDELGRPIWRIGSRGLLQPGATASFATHVGLDQCRPLAGRGATAYRQSLDARFRDIPPARIAGPSVLAIRLRVFEATGARKP